MNIRRYRGRHMRPDQKGTTMKLRTIRRRTWIISGTVAGALALAVAAFAAVLLMTQHTTGTVTSDPRPTVSLLSVSTSDKSNTGMQCDAVKSRSDIALTIRGYGGDTCVITARLKPDGMNQTLLPAGSMAPTGTGAELVSNVQLVADNSGPFGAYMGSDLKFKVTIPATTGATTLDLQFPFQLDDGRS